MRDITFTKRKYDEIVEAWNYNCAASCNKAISELSEFAKEINNGNSVIVESENIRLTQLSDFIEWKNQDFILKQINITIE